MPDFQPIPPQGGRSLSGARQTAQAGAAFIRMSGRAVSFR